MQIMTRGNGQPIIISGAFGDTVPHCTGVVEVIKQAGPDGEFFTKYIGCEFHFKGFLDKVSLQSIYSAKRLIAGIPQLFSSAWIAVPAAIVGSFIAIMPRAIKKRILLPMGTYLSEGAYMSMHQFVPPKSQYSRPVRALYDPATKMIHAIFKDPRVIEIIIRIRDIILMLFQFDIAYRFRYQDIFPLINKEAIATNPRKELMRVFKIYMERETSEGIKQKWNSLFSNLNIVLWIVFLNKHRRAAIICFFREVDMMMVSRDRDDWYYVLDRKDFLYGGATHEARLEIARRMDKEAGNKRPTIEIVEGNEERVEFVTAK